MYIAEVLLVFTDALGCFTGRFIIAPAIQESSSSVCHSGHQNCPSSATVVSDVTEMVYCF